MWSLLFIKQFLKNILFDDRLNQIKKYFNFDFVLQFFVFTLIIFQNLIITSLIEKEIDKNENQFSFFVKNKKKLLQKFFLFLGFFLPISIAYHTHQYRLLNLSLLQLILYLVFLLKKEKIENNLDYNTLFILFLDAFFLILI